MKKKPTEVGRGNAMEKEFLELPEASKPLVEYIRKNYTPMTTAIVTGVNVEILNTEIGIPFDEDWD